MRASWQKGWSSEALAGLPGGKLNGNSCLEEDRENQSAAGRWRQARAGSYQCHLVNTLPPRPVPNIYPSVCCRQPPLRIFHRSTRSNITCSSLTITLLSRYHIIAGYRCADVPVTCPADAGGWRSKSRWRVRAPRHYHPIRRVHLDKHIVFRGAQLSWLGWNNRMRWERDRIWRPPGRVIRFRFR